MVAFKALQNSHKLFVSAALQPSCGEQVEPHGAWLED
jgi:hypothetical protein